MAKVVISGWEPGFRKVTCTRLLRAYTELNLAEAKAVTDRVLVGEAVDVAVASPEVAVDLARQLCAIGVRAAAVAVPLSLAAVRANK